MNKRISLLAVVLLGVLMLSVLSGCTVTPLPLANFDGNGKVVTTEETLDGAGYQLIVSDLRIVETPADTASITIDESLEDKLSLSTDENILETIKVTVDEDTRIIRIKGNKKYRYDITSLKIELGCPVKSIQIDGGFKLDANLPTVTEFDMTINGAVAGNLVFDRLDTFAVEINGASELTLTGECADSTIVTNGASQINALDFITENTSVSLRGASNAEVYVTGTLDAEINGLGAITYAGSPANINREVEGLGTIQAKE